MKKYFSTYLDKHHLVTKLHKQFIFFTLIGLFCFIVDLSLLAFLVELLKLDIILSVAVSFICVAYINYLLSVKYLFINGKYGRRNEVLGFLVIAIIAFVLNILLMNYFTNNLKIYYIISKIITVAIVSILNFSLKKWALFVK